MKKFFIMAVAALAMVFASCTNKTEKAAEETGVTVESAIEDLQALINGEDANALTTALEAIQEKAAEIAGTLNLESAKEYLEKVKTLVAENADKIKGLVNNEAVNTLVDGIANCDVENAVSTLAAAAKVAGVEAAADAAATVEEAKEAIEAAPEAVKEAAKEAAQEAADAAVEAAKDKANEAIDKGVSDSKKKLGL